MTPYLILYDLLQIAIVIIAGTAAEYCISFFACLPAINASIRNEITEDECNAFIKAYFDSRRWWHYLILFIPITIVVDRAFALLLPLP